MLRNAFVIVIAVGMLFGGLLSPASAANRAKVNAAIAARQAALAPAAKKRHKRHHHKRAPTAAAVPAVK
jgi:hypothetical protein